MKKSVVWIGSLVAILILFISIPFVSAQTYSGFNRFTDNVKLFFSKGDNKVKLALEIREKEVNSAIFNLEAGNTEKAAKNINSASEKLKIVQTQASPDISEDIKSNIEEVVKKIKENRADYKLLEKYLTEEEKTKLSIKISEKVFNYCNELAMQNYELMVKEEKCGTYIWMEKKVKERVNEEQKKSQEEIGKQVQNCINNPKRCNCDNIKISSEKAKCEKLKASAIECEFQGDSSACEETGIFKPEKSEREDQEKQIIEKYLPAECSEAGVRNGEECKKLILTLNQPKTECMKNGEYIGDEKCREKLVKEGDVVEECVVNEKIVDSNECLRIVKEGNKPTGKEWELMSGECKERGIYDSIACDEIVNLPRPCKDAGYYTKKECEVFTLKQNMPQECVDGGALTPESCEKFKLPQKCRGKAFSNEECEAVFIKEKMPPECQESGTYNFHKCAKLLYEKVSDISIEGEIEYLNKKGISFEEIPSVCLNGNNFVRGMQCDEALIKEFGIMLPPPVETTDIPVECMGGGAPVSPEECEEILQGEIIQEAIPKECQEANITNPDDCGKLIEEKRLQEGIGLNMPLECVGIPVEDCKKIMEEKEIKIEKNVFPGEFPEECAKLGISDNSDCKIVMSKINEERIKNGEKVIIDENGKVDYINPEQVENIIEYSEKISWEIKPNLEQAEEIEREIEVLEKEVNQINRVEEKKDISQETEEGNNGGREIVTDRSGSSDATEGGSEVVNDRGETDENGESGSGGSGGESAPITGESIGSGNYKSSFLEKILKEIFGKRK